MGFGMSAFGGKAEIDFGPLEVRLWLQGDMQAPEIDFRLTPDNGHPEGYAGLPGLTQRRSQPYRRKQSIGR